MDIIGALQSIPSAFWVGIIGSISALAGVLLANKSNTTRLRIQLDHDSHEKSRQRLADLRKNVYLDAAEELVKANAYLGSLIQADLTKLDTPTQVQSFMAAAAKVQLVSSPATVTLVADLVATFSEALFESLVMLKPVQDARTGAKIADEFYEGRQTEIKKLLTEMRESGEAGRKDHESLARLNQQFDGVMKQSEEYADERSMHQKQMTISQLAFMRSFLPKIKAIGMKSALATAAIRRELDLDGESQFFEEQQKQQWTRIEAAIDGFAKSVLAMHDED